MASLPARNAYVTREIDLYLEDFHERSMEAGDQMQRADLGMAQVRGLETLVVSTRRFSEIINYIKNQAGKDNRGQWIQVAPGLLEQLKSLEAAAVEMDKKEAKRTNAPETDPGRILDIKLELARGWAKQVVTHYLYQRFMQGKGRMP